MSPLFGRFYWIEWIYADSLCLIPHFIFLLYRFSSGLLFCFNPSKLALQNSPNFRTCYSSPKNPSIILDSSVPPPILHRHRHRRHQWKLLPKVTAGMSAFVSSTILRRSGFHLLLYVSVPTRVYRCMYLHKLNLFVYVFFYADFCCFKVRYTQCLANAPGKFIRMFGDLGIGFLGRIGLHCIGKNNTNTILSCLDWVKYAIWSLFFNIIE